MAFVAVFGTATGQAGLETGFHVGIILPGPGAEADAIGAAVARAAAQGAEMANDEFGFNAEMLEYEFSAEAAVADGPGAVVAAAQTLLDEHGVYGIVGGFDAAEAEALAGWADEAGVPFINVGASADVLRNEQCKPSLFHVEPSATMYLDAMAGWYVRSGLRDWYFLLTGDDESSAQLNRIERTLEERHFAANVAGSAVVGPDTDWDDVASRISRSRADLVVLFMSAEDQLAAVHELDARGASVMVTGYPYQEAQTRDFYRAWRAAAPTLGTGYRISAWEATLDAYGARELNARYRAMYGEPMDTSAWAVYQGVKILYEAAFFGGSADPGDVMAYLTDAQSVFDVWKGIGTSFRPWDRQLRQPLYLVKIDQTAEAAFTLATLVGELPAIYMPGTEVAERLDQLGELAAASRCGR
jgi:ABC transporter substrate binding protein (PQQ-dependent alcohol dehydrogenase system)